jgi:hypothetical protein
MLIRLFSTLVLLLCFADSLYGQVRPTTLNWTEGKTTRQEIEAAIGPAHQSIYHENANNYFLQWYFDPNLKRLDINVSFPGVKFPTKITTSALWLGVDQKGVLIGLQPAPAQPVVLNWTNEKTTRKEIEAALGRPDKSEYFKESNSYLLKWTANPFLKYFIINVTDPKTNNINTLRGSTVWVGVNKDNLLYAIRASVLKDPYVAKSRSLNWPILSTSRKQIDAILGPAQKSEYIPNADGFVYTWRNNDNLVINIIDGHNKILFTEKGQNITLFFDKRGYLTGTAKLIR